MNFHRTSGFALVITLSLMILLTVIAVGLLSLSSVSLRATSQSEAMASARANARMAMMLALGELQKQTGPDTRITARADILDAQNPCVTGVWRSWEGANHDPQTGKPIAPDYSSKNKVGDAMQATASSAGGRFLGWLSSTTADSAPLDLKIQDIFNKSNADTVTMVAAGSVADPRGEVHAKPTMIGKDGSMAWWVSGENSKAMMNVGRGKKPQSMVEWQQRVRSTGRADAETFGLAKINDYPQGTVIPGRGSLKLINPAQDFRKLHDLTASSRGLLVNAATGGWRKDLSLLVENWDSLPASGLPFFTLAPGKELAYSKADDTTTANTAGYRPLLYPWSRYRNNATGNPCLQAPPICSWSALIDYARQYVNLTTSDAARTAMTVHIPPYWVGSRLNYQDKVRRVPHIARIQWIYSLGSRRSPADPSKYNPGILVTPVLTLWNPFNVELTIAKYSLEMQETAPLRFKMNVGGTPLPEASLSDISKAGGGYRRFFLNINSPVTLLPGATRIYSTTDKIPLVNTGATSLALKPGYTPGGGVLYTYINKGAEISANGGDTFEVEKITYDAMTSEGGKNGFGIVYDIQVNGSSPDHSNRASAQRMVYNVAELGGQSIVDKLYPPLTNRASATVSSIESVSGGAGSIPSRPFASALFGYRMASPLSRDPNHKHLHSKGMLQANPLSYYVEIGYADDNNAFITMAGTGVYHPVNSPCDFVFEELDGWNDTRAPQWDGVSGGSYIVSGLGPNDGLTRCVIAELPTRPLQSLAELQHFDARNNNPFPPFHFNLIGNGSANPLFEPDKVSVEIAKTHNNYGMCNDDSYVLNHLLFDDWFVSSITPELDEFSRTVKRDAAQVYREHMQRATPLPNCFYLPAEGADMVNGVADPDKAVAAAIGAKKDSATGKYPFETIASKLEVEGMFNINSTSLEAWKSLLRQGRGLKVPWLDSNGATRQGAESSFSFPRSSITGDQSSVSGSRESGPDFSDAAEFAGHRALTDAQIDALAGEIIKEIRKRGPFLSLAEFVNRRLGSDKDLAIASAIQKALDNLAARGNAPENPYSKIQAIAPEVTASPPGVTDYKFPEAALGSSAFGVPGWIRQADILQPLAPILTPRDDTFTIRAYGDARDSQGRITARAWCEAVVHRTADYLDPADSAGVAPHSSLMTSEINRRFGRRYRMEAFRWLDEKEI